MNDSESVSHPASSSPREAWLATALLVLSILIIYVSSVGSRGPWRPDEPRYMEVAREMAVEGSYMLPLLNGETYFEKPPFYFLIVILIERATGSFVTAARLASALAVAVAAVFVGRLGRHLYDERTGHLAALVFATSFLVVTHGQRAAIDPTLAALTTIATWGLVRAGDATARPPRLLFTLVAAVALALSVVTKGHVGLLVPVAGAVALSWARGLTVPFVPIACGVAAAALVGLGWAKLADLQAGPEAGFFDRVVLGQVAGRVVSSAARKAPHANPWYDYLEQLAWGPLPWTCFLPGAVIACVRARARDRAGLGLLAWALSLFLVFSAISGKRSGYLLPLYPAFAILIARHLLDPKPAWAGRAGSALAALLLVLTGATLLGLRPLAGWLPGIVSGRNAAALQGLATVLTPGRVAMAAGLGCAILGLGVCLFFFRNRIGARGTVFTLALATALASLAAHTTFVHAFDRAFSVAPLGELVAREHPRGERLVLAPENFSGIVNLYTGARHYDVLATPEALRAALDEQGRLFVVTHHHFRDSLEADLRARLETRGAHRIGRDLMVVLAEAPARRSGN